MKNHPLRLLPALTALLCLAAPLACAAPGVGQAGPRPNIVFILADDLGLGDVSHHVRTFQEREPVVETPTLDALARQGLWFTDGHSATALCAPTRYAVMSGNNNYRSYQPVGVWSTFGKTAFKPEEATLGSVVQDAGYRTGFIGKWHLGGDFKVPGGEAFYRGPKSGDLTGKVDVTRMHGGGPKDCGFDYDFTVPCGIQGPVYTAYENQVWYPLADDSEIVFLNDENAIHPKDLTSKGPGPGDSAWNARSLGDLLSAKAVGFIEAGAAGEEPFFLYYCTPMVHAPHCPPETFDGQPVAGTTVSAHLDMVVELDLQVKRIVDALKRSGQFENTLFVVSSDNGGLGDKVAAKHGYHPSGGWSGSKGSYFEGGHRTPLFAVWPGRIRPGVSDELVVNQDMLATFAALVGTPVPAGQAQDSLNLLPLLLGDEGFRPRDVLVHQAGSRQQVMIRRGAWKLVIQSNGKRTQFEPLALFNLDDDPREKHDRLEDPDHADRGRLLMQEYLDIVQSGRPTVPQATP